MIKRRKESDTYLAADRRQRRSMQIAMKVDKVCSFVLQLMKAAVSAESHFHRDLGTPAMSSVSCQVRVSLFPSF